MVEMSILTKAEADRHEFPKWNFFKTLMINKMLLFVQSLIVACYLSAALWLGTHLLKCSAEHEMRQQRVVHPIQHGRNRNSNAPWLTRRISTQSRVDEWIKKKAGLKQNLEVKLPEQARQGIQTMNNKTNAYYKSNTTYINWTDYRCPAEYHNILYLIHHTFLRFLFHILHE